MNPISLSPGSAPHAQDHTKDCPLDGLTLVLEAWDALLTSIPGWPGGAQRGSKGDTLALTAHIYSDTGCSQPKYSEFLGLKTKVVWSARGAVAQSHTGCAPQPLSWSPSPG